MTGEIPKVQQRVQIAEPADNSVAAIALQQQNSLLSSNTLGMNSIGSPARTPGMGSTETLER